MGNWIIEGDPSEMTGRKRSDGHWAECLHELGHAFWIGHNSEPDSVMNPAAWPHRLSPRDTARIVSNGCKDYQ